MTSNQELAESYLEDAEYSINEAEEAYKKAIKKASSIELLGDAKNA